MMEYINYQDSYTEYLKEIPSHWQLKKLKYSAKSPKESIAVSEFEQDAVIHYSIPNIQEFGKGQLESGKEIDSAKIKLSGGEVLISKLNPRKATICIVEQHDELIVGSGEFIPFIPRDCDNKFLYYFFRSSQFTDYLNSCVESVTRSHQRIKPELIYNSFIGLPLQEEQKAIVSFLDHKTEKIDKLIQLKERKIELLKEKRAALINDLVTGKLVWDGKDWGKPKETKDSGVEWIGEIPSNWDFSRIGRYMIVVRGGSPRPAGDPRFFNGDFIPWITVKEVTGKEGKYVVSTDSFLTEEGMKQSRVLNSETLVLSNSGATLGVPAILKLTGCANDGVVAFEKISDKVDRDYLYYFWVTQTKRLLEEQSGYGQPNLNREIVSNVISPIPPIEEQIAIVSLCDKALENNHQLIKSEQSKIELLKEYSQSLISEVVTGKLRVVEEDHSITSQPQLN